MNHIYKIVFNKDTGQSVAVSEFAKGAGKTGSNKTKKISLALACGLVSFSGLADSLSVGDGELVVVESGSSYVTSSGSENNGNVWYTLGGGIEGGDNITLTMGGDDVLRGIYAVNNTVSTGTSSVTVGNDFTIINNINNDSASYGAYLVGNQKDGAVSNFVFGDRLTIKTGDDASGRIAAMRIAGSNTNTIIGNDAYLEGLANALTISGNTQGMANLSVGNNSTFVGMVLGQANSNIELASGATIILDNSVTAGEIFKTGTYSPVLLGLNGAGSRFVASDISLKLNEVGEPNDLQWRENGAVIRLSNNNMRTGEGVYSEVLGEYDQIMVLEGVDAQIGTESQLNKADFLQVVQSSHRSSVDAEPGHSYIYLKDVNISSAGGHLVYIVNDDFDYIESSGDYNYQASNNKATIILDNVDGSAQTDGIYLESSNVAGLTTIELINGTKVSGGVVNDSNGSIDLTVENSLVTGDVVNNGEGDVVVTVNDSGIVVGNVVNNSDTGALDMTVNEGGSWIGDAVKGGEADLTVTVNEGGNWAGTGENIGLWVKQNSTYTAGDKSSSFTSIKMDKNSTLDFGSPASDFAFKTIHTSGNMEQTDGGIANVRMNTNLGLGKGDLLSVDGQMAGKYQVDVRNRGKAATKANGALRIIKTGTGMAAQSTTTGSDVTLAGNQYRDSGMLRYHLVKDASGTGYWLVNGDGSEASYGGGDDDLAKSGQAFDEQGGFDAFVAGEGFVAQKATSDLAHTLQGASAAQTVNLLDQSRNINKRMDNLRLSGIQKENVWMNYYHNDATVGADVIGNEFDTKSDMVYLGGDKTFAVSENADLSVGLFGGVGKVSTDYKLNNSNGSSDIHTIGVYGMWLHDSGVFANSSAQAFHISTQDKAYDEQGELTSYKMSSAAVSVGLDVGKRFTMDNGAYIEPMLKVAHLHETGDRFSTDANSASLVDVERGSVNAFQYGLGLNVGSTMVLGSEDSYVQPYLNVSLVDQIISGGEIDSSGVQMKSNLEGYQFNTTAGVNWQINKTHRVFAELGGGFGETYDENFNVGIGYQASF
ncbi:hypothetical protein C1N32_05415 [Vibrio diazotrophicus]|uniref:Autotransporter domain-containing protein n=1 Tax=Vibrio diazotrophicus TaxID=685 RepID=A0A2J8I5T0_VIBDI|nr:MULTISPECIES: autotransporter outer membrane beta-barrel domain-containing protein [Vibrio]MCF7361914.1 autotransporter outer membrane beta-barrel domain-containing protein [Vibrio sp. A1-b2]PNI05882.1 hypothetical protein C1N32_05415 [Vibrio diazotrophicus]